MDNRSRAASRDAKPNNTKEVIPQIAYMLHSEALDIFDDVSKKYLMSMFGSVLWEQFCDAQIRKKEKEILELSPERYTPEQFSKLASDMRLVWRLWTDLKRFGLEFKPRPENS